MFTIFSFAVCAALNVATLFVQLAPTPPNEKVPLRSPGQKRAVVLIHGLMLQPFSREKVESPVPHKWQRRDMPMVKKLAQHADVFMFSYSQNVPIETVVPKSDLKKNIQWLRDLGYQEIVLVAHSAGGLIARQLIEDNPKIGIDKVIQVCSPNGGATLAHIRPVRSNQKPFLVSLTRSKRKEYLAQRKNVVIPKHVQFVCIVANGVADGDGILFPSSVWTEDLQAQGIPCYPLAVTHRRAVRGEMGANLVLRLMTAPQPRWNEAQVERARRQIFGDDE